MNYSVQYDSSLITPAQAVLLLDTIPFILNGYQPRQGQTRVETAELLTLAGNLEERHRHVLERSGAWVEL